MLAILFAVGLFLRVVALAVDRPKFEHGSLAANDASPSLNVSSCPGYTVASHQESGQGLFISLMLAGPACDAFGHDVLSLTVEVSYETSTRLHVNIYDTEEVQFTVPEDVVPLPPGEDDATLETRSDYEFHHNPDPFEFWITRRSEPDSPPLFDTRRQSLPQTPIPPVIPTDNSTALDGFPLAFENRYLQLTSALPHGANVYGLGEVLASSGFRRDVGTNGGGGTVQTMWARDSPDPIDENIYGSHLIYLEHRYDAGTRRSKSHGVFHFGAAGSDILLLTPPSSPVSLIQYRLVGGTLDFCFFSGPSPQ